MPAESKAQQKAMGLAHAIQKGEVPMSEAHGAAREIAKSMKPSDTHDFASTKHKGLPEHVKKKSSVDRLWLAALIANSVGN